MADNDVFTARHFITDYVSFIIHQGYQSRFDSSSGMNYVMSSDADNNHVFSGFSIIGIIMVSQFHSCQFYYIFINSQAGVKC